MACNVINHTHVGTSANVHKKPAILRVLLLKIKLLIIAYRNVLGQNNNTVIKVIERPLCEEKTR